MILRMIAYGYKIRKPRVLTDNDLSLIRYKKQLTDVRRNIHIEANEYQNNYQNLFLQRHKQQMLDKHRKNQMNYRSQIIRNGWRLMRNIEKWKTRDEIKKERLQGFIHKQNLKKMNRDRILKILNYESQHFWFTPENIEEKLLEETIQPEFAGSTEHYQLLTQQALAYQKLEFENLETLQSDEHTMRFKNRLLIPIYNEVVQLVKKVKSNEFKDNETEYLTKVDRIEKLYNFEDMKQEKQRQLTKAKEQYQQVRRDLLKKMQNPSNRQAFIKTKIVQIRNLLFFWKQYAKVLNLSNIELELVRKKGEIDRKLSIVATKLADNEYKMRKQNEKQTVFSHVQQANTDQQEQVDMESFLKGSNETDQPYEGRIKVNLEDMQKLDELLESSENVVTELKEKIEKAGKTNDERKRLGLYRDLNVPLDTNISIPEKDRFKENSSVLIEGWKRLTKDPELKALLDEVGQIHVEQSALFWKVFSTH